MATISFTKAELDVLFDELGMIVEACDLAIEDDVPRSDDDVVRRIYNKLSLAKFSRKHETLEQWRDRNKKYIDNIISGYR